MPREEAVRVYVSSLGCKLNQSEMDSLAGQLVEAGHQAVSTPAEADLCVFNTCAVTHVAAQKSRQALRRLHRENPRLRLVVTGCYAELSPADLRGLAGVELVVGNEGKDQLAALLGGGDPAQPLPPSAPGRRRTRALVKIQDGCDNACSYCIIRVARGRQRSRDPEEIVAEIRSGVAAGHQEIVLTGVHIGAYGRDAHGSGQGPDLWALVARILAETDAPRLRLSSIEPWDLPAQAFRLWADTRLCRHLHLPLQSGSKATLRRMARRYTPAEFGRLVEEARAAIPEVAITTDVIAGFPGETGAEFAESLAFVQAMAFARVHVFPYSPRPGTPAAQMPEQIPPTVKAERARSLRAVASASSQAFRQRFVGRTMSVLWETPRWVGGERMWSGLTDNYLRVYARSSSDLAGRQTPARLLGLTPGGLTGLVET